jgi:Zn-dependent membrane protease YugP
VPGQLTDHYDPRSKVVRLSGNNFRQRSIAAVSVAAHEVGHAIQDATGYIPMKLRSGLFPVVAFSSQIWLPLFIIGIFIGAPLFIQLAAILFVAVLAFHVVTLPVEINASTRAYGLLTHYGILSRTEAGGTRRVLAAAFTYLAAALTAFLTLLYLLFLSQNE